MHAVYEQANLCFSVNELQNFSSETSDDSTPYLPLFRSNCCCILDEYLHPVYLELDLSQTYNVTPLHPHIPPTWRTAASIF